MAKKLKKKAKKTEFSGTEAERVKKTKIRVIGIGGGGGNIVSEIASRVERASFVVANTDNKALREASRKASRFQFGQNLTHGLGTGMNPELGESAAQSEKEKIKKILEGQDLLIIVACLGGGVGSGAAPIFAKISKPLGNLTYGIFTLPFEFEGEKKMEIARTALEKIRPYLNAFSVIPNERIFQVIDKDTPLKQALSAINKSLADALEGLIEIIYEPGLINIDFADLKTILSGRGRLAYLNTVIAPRSENFPREAVEKVLNSPLYPYTIRGAKSALFNIIGGKEMNLSEVSQISKTISDLLNKEAKIIFGVSQQRQCQDKIKTTLLATGCTMKIFSSKMKNRVPQRRDEGKEEDEILFARKKRKRKEKPLLQEPEIKQPEKPKEKEVKISKELKAASKGGEPRPNLFGREARQKTAPRPEAEPEEVKKVLVSNPPAEKIRKNALEIKREMEEIEKEMLGKEQSWETPAFLRKKLIKGQ